MKLPRRTVLGLGAAIAVVGGGAGLARLLARRDLPRGLRLDPTGVFHLADGFRCVVLDRVGDRMSDGLRVPGRPDGMGCFSTGDGAVVLMRNHELLPDDPGPIDRARPPAEAFDPESQGGVSRLVVDVAALRRGASDVVRSSNLVLAGTNFNCAGGRSPWGWLSCEENVAEGHGFVFVCPIDAERLARPAPVPAWGRFRHEAAAVDPTTGVVYLTEDREDACLYRFVPTDRERPFEGRLEALAIAGAAAAEAEDLEPRAPRTITWVPVADPTPADDSCRARAQAAGAAVFRRLEGIDAHDGAVVFTSTTGGRGRLGQIFRLRPDGAGGALELLHESADPGALSMPDNVIVSPWGDLYLAEDGRPPNGIRCLTRRGAVRALASGALSGGEVSGVCFTPEGDVLFANLQADGLTAAIVGPFEAFGA
jgi:secreted PhoX family phosphatase